MIKKFLKITIFIFFIELTLGFISPPRVLGVNLNDPCSKKGEITDCTCILPSTGERKICCCVCDGKNWVFYHEGICEPGDKTHQIENPALKAFGYGKGADIIAQLIANTLKLLFSLIGVILLAMLIWGSIRWLTAGSDKEKVAKAQGTITSALVGFLIFMSVFAIINFLAPALGFDFLQILKIEWPTP